MKKITLILSAIVIIVHPGYANQLTCPTVNDIQHNIFNTWLPLYIDNSELASLADIEKFKAHVKQFDLAAWDKSYLENAHCFYQGDDAVVSRITIAHDAFRPIESKSWHWVDPLRRAECTASAAYECQLYS